MKSRVFIFISLFALLAAIAGAPAASAQSSPAQNVYNPNNEVLDFTDGQYSNNEEQDVCTGADGRDSDGNTVEYGSLEDCSTGSLPFTGFEAGMIGLAGLLLLGGGVAMRRFTRRESL